MARTILGWRILSCPPVGQNGVLAKVISDSLCMSSYKATKGRTISAYPTMWPLIRPLSAMNFADRSWRSAKNGATNPAGRPFFHSAGALYEGSLLAPGYSYSECGGTQPMSTSAGNHADGLSAGIRFGHFFYGSLAEPMSCMYHIMSWQL